MEIVECTIKRVGEFKFQIAVPLRHITINLSNNIMVAKNKLEQQRQSLKCKCDRIAKYHQKVTGLKTHRYIEKVDPEEPMASGNL